MQAYRLRNPAVVLLSLAKQRARKKGVDFSITEKDIRIGKRCPVLGMLFTRGRNKRVTPASPTLDRLRPWLGYVPGNVVVISSLANRIKSTANTKQIRKVALWLERRLAASATRTRATSAKRRKRG